MSIVGGLDGHRAQITYDYLDVETGGVETGRIVPATRVELRDWLSRFDGVEAVFATEGCTGWRFVVEELERAGVEAHLAEPAETATFTVQSGLELRHGGSGRAAAEVFWRVHRDYTGCSGWELADCRR